MCGGSKTCSRIHSVRMLLAQVSCKMLIQSRDMLLTWHPQVNYVSMSFIAYATGSELVLDRYRGNLRRMVFSALSIMSCVFLIVVVFTYVRTPLHMLGTPCLVICPLASLVPATYVPSLGNGSCCYPFPPSHHSILMTTAVPRAAKLSSRSCLKILKFVGR